MVLVVRLPMHSILRNYPRFSFKTLLNHKYSNMICHSHAHNLRHPCMNPTCVEDTHDCVLLAFDTLVPGINNIDWH